MDRLAFDEALQRFRGEQVGARGGIGTLGEKTVHAVLKHYFCPDPWSQEIKLSRYVADIVGESGIIEIQTRGFDKLRRKLAAFLECAAVTVVYPLPRTKWLVWIEEDTGSVSNKRRSPKTGRPYDALWELYRIKEFLTHPSLRLCIVMLDMEEYRLLNGYSADKKKGSTRYERVPVALADEIWLRSPEDYIQLIPPELPLRFTSKDYRRAARMSLSTAQTALNVLHAVGAVLRVEKQGNTYVYERAFCTPIPSKSVEM